MYKYASISMRLAHHVEVVGARVAAEGGEVPPVLLLVAQDRHHTHTYI